MPLKNRAPRWLSIVSLVLALVAIGIGLSSWMRPMQTGEPSATPPAPIYSDRQITDAKALVCAAYEKVHHALVLSSGRNGDSDPTAILAVATSGRQVLDAGSRYLLMKLSKEPATPADLATAIRRLADSYQELTIDYLDGLTNSDAELGPSLQASDEATSTIERLCK